MSSLSQSSAVSDIGEAWCREEGLRAFWKGNGTNVVRIFPYSAVQFSANEQYKALLASEVPWHNSLVYGRL